MGSKRGSIILSQELLDEYIDARGLDQITVNDKVRWRHNCGTEWGATVSDRRKGRGCPTCGGSQKGAFRKHPVYGGGSRALDAQILALNRIPTPHAIPQGVVLRLPSPDLIKQQLRSVT